MESVDSCLVAMSELRITGLSCPLATLPPSPRSLRSSDCSRPPPQPLPSDPLTPRPPPRRIPMVWTVCLRLPRRRRVPQLCTTYLL
ncbi:hypothetical protein Pcinc_003581 [Petrolisthes cinctipes]|uniref:Uncharacterized protein n=1 Tax=Petrolisthes cinctipes TaxID=88211 RepID=A0AAE1GH40_PETCI|nr:hypothetical protein Pcinc_003581 [Petrolisthes cinctipes]